jgi:hypothetical protein
MIFSKNIAYTKKIMPKAANGPMKPNMWARNEAKSNPPMFPNTIYHRIKFISFTSSKL